MLDKDLQPRLIVIAGGGKTRAAKRRHWLIAAAGISLLLVAAASAYLSDPDSYRPAAQKNASDPTPGSAGVP